MARRSNPWIMWWETATAVNAAAVTIAIRSTRVPLMLATGDRRGAPESRRMVNEKAKAVADGYFALWSALPSMMLASPAFRGADAWHEMLNAGYVFSRPGMRKAKANAKRLARWR